MASTSYTIRGVRVKHHQLYNRKARDYSGRVHLCVYDETWKGYWTACKPETQNDLRVVGTDLRGMDRPKTTEVTCFTCRRLRARLRLRGTFLSLRNTSDS